MMLVSGPICPTMALLRAVLEPAGIESGQNATLCGPPETLIKRTVVPGATVKRLGSYAALSRPFPVMRTSTTLPDVPGAAAGGRAAGGAGGRAAGGRAAGGAVRGVALGGAGGAGGVR